MTYAASRTIALLLLVASLAGACGNPSRPSLTAEGGSPPDLVSSNTVGGSATTDAAAASTTTTATGVDPTTAPPSPAACLRERVPLRGRLAQLLFPLVSMAQLSTAAQATADGEIAGIVLLGNGPADLAQQLAGLQGTAPLGLLIAVDEEGGRVQRLRDLVGSVPSARTLVETGDAVAARAVAEQLGRDLAALGITIDLSPVLDVGGGPGIGDRSYSDDPAVVTEFGLAVLDGLVAGGVRPVVKHFPGHGRASGDTHQGLAITPAIDEIRATDLPPFQAAIADGRAAVMVGHMAVPGLTYAPGFTEPVPASLSPEAVTGLLRDELGFDGLVMTDDLGMGAVDQRFGVIEAVERAIAAGVDLAMIPRPADAAPVLDALEAAVAEGRLTEERIDESVLRVLEAKGVDPCAVLLLPPGPAGVPNEVIE